MHENLLPMAMKISVFWKVLTQRGSDTKFFAVGDLNHDPAVYAVVENIRAARVPKSAQKMPVGITQV